MSDANRVGPTVRFFTQVVPEKPDDRHLAEELGQDAGEANNSSGQKETSLPDLFSELGQTMLEAAKKDPYAEKAAELIEGNPKDAVKFLESLSLDKAVDGILTAIAQMLAKRDLAGTSQWLSGLKPGYTAKILDAMKPADVAKMLACATDKNDAVNFLCNIQRVNPRDGYTFLEALIDLGHGRAVELLNAAKIGGQLDRFCQMFVAMCHTGKTDTVVQMLRAASVERQAAVLQVIKGKELGTAPLIEAALAK